MSAPMSALAGGRGSDRDLMVVGIATTLVLHGAIAAAVLLSAFAKPEAPPVEPPRKIVFEDVQLLALGEEVPKRMLPRIANPKPPAPTPEPPEPEPPRQDEPKPPKDAITLPSKDPKPAPKPQARPKAPSSTKASRRSAMDDALAGLHDPNRPTNDDKQAGSKQGVLGGQLSDAAKANLMASYAAQLNTALSRYWTLPTTVPREAIKQLAGQVRVYVRLSRDGRIVSYVWRRHSANEQFDASIDRLLRSFQSGHGTRRLPVPESAEVLQLVVSEGLVLKTWEYTGK